MGPSPRGSFAEFSLCPCWCQAAGPWQQELIQLDPMPTPPQLQPCQDDLLSSLLSWLQGVPRCTEMASHRIRTAPLGGSNSGSSSHRSLAAWEVCSSTSLREGASPCTPAVCSKLWLVVTARGYCPYLNYLQKVGSSTEELFHGYTNKNVLFSCSL